MKCINNYPIERCNKECYCGMGRVARAFKNKQLNKRSK